MTFSRFPLCLLLPLVLLGGCQRLPETGGPVTSAANDGTDGATSAGTFLPQPGSTGVDETGGDPMGNDACDAVAQTGCSTGERCTAVGASGGVAFFGCVPDDGLLEPFDPCEALGGGLDGCPAGHACITNFAGDGACLPLCKKTADCNQGACTISTLESFPYCADDCSPFEPLCTPPTQCRRNGERFSCRVPQETDVGGVGSPCSTLDDGGCTTGLICVPGALVPECNDQNCCVPLCELDGSDPCTSPATCNSALSAPAPGFDNIGACFVPS